MLASVATSEGWGGAIASNNFRVAKCGALFISSSSQETIKNKVIKNGGGWKPPNQWCRACEEFLPCPVWGNLFHCSCF